MIAGLTLCLILAVLFGMNRLYQNWLGRSRPSDIPLIKAKLEEAERRVVDIQYDGFIPGGSYGLGYRKYRAVVRSPIGEPDKIREMGVWPNLLGVRGLVDLDRPHP